MAVHTLDIQRRVDRILDMGIWQEDDEGVLVQASQDKRLWAKIMDWRPELRPGDYTTTSNDVNVRKLRDLLWTSEVLQTNPISRDDNPYRFPGWCQRLWRQLVSWTGLTAHSSAAYVAASNSWARLDTLGDPRTGVPLDAPDRALMRNPGIHTDAAMQSLKTSMSIVQMSKTVSNLQAIVSSEKNEAFRDAAQDTCKIVEEAVDQIRRTADLVGADDDGDRGVKHQGAHDIANLITEPTIARSDNRRKRAAAVAKGRASKRPRVSIEPPFTITKGDSDLLQQDSDHTAIDAEEIEDRGGPTKDPEHISSLVESTQASSTQRQHPQTPRQSNLQEYFSRSDGK